MKASINRFAFYLALLLPFFAASQTIPSSFFKDKKLPANHPKAAALGSGLAGQTTAVVPAPQVFPVCAFDEMNEAECLQNPALAEELHRHVHEALPMLSANGAEKNMVEPLLTISVVVHVIHNGEAVGTGQNLSTEKIQAQIEVLNEDFASLNSQFYNTPSQWMGIAGFPNIQFCLANKKPDGSPTNGIDRKQMTVIGSTWNNNNINSTIKPSIRWDPTRYLNVYVLPIPGTTALGGVVGFSNYPVSSQIGGNTDGVVIDYRWFGAPGFSQSGYRTLTHEIGHYLGLPHPFNGNSCTQDDGISDTPNVEVPTTDLANLDCNESFPDGPASCGNEHLYVNYMDYVTENCYTSFTAGQVNVMRAVLNGTSSGFGYGSRNALVQNAPNQCSIPATDAGIVRVVSPDNVACTTGQLTPTVTLRNFGTNNLTSANIFYRINNGAPTSFNWQGSLFPGQNVDVNLAPITPAGGSYSFTAWTTLPNGQADQRSSNDSVSVNRFAYISTAPPMYENVEGETSLPTSEGIFALNVSQDEFAWQVTNEASAYDDGGTSFMFDNFNDINGNNPFGTLDALVTRHFDFTNVQDAILRFDVAYAPYIEDVGDSLLVLVATNCSQNFNQIVYRKGGMDLATAPIAASPFTPTASQWRNETVDLSAYDGFSDVTIALVNLSAFGNRLFIDNIGIGRNCNAQPPVVTNAQPDDCAQVCNGAATVQLPINNGGLQYDWEGFSGINQATNNQLCIGTSSVTITDAIGCQASLEVQTVGVVAPDLLTNATNVTTFGVNNGAASVSISGGVAPYSYVWSNGFQQNNVSTTTSTAANLAPGSYSVSVTSANGCVAIAEIEVGSVCNGFAVSTSPINLPCNGVPNGSITASTTNGTGPFSYNWNNGQTGPTAQNLAGGNYSVTVTDANGCPSSSSQMLQQLPAIQLSVSPTNQTVVGQNDGTATASASGGSGNFSFSWSNGMSGNPITGLAPGNYTVTATDASNCQSTASTTVNSVNCGAFSADLAIVNPTCFGVPNGSAAVSVNGGTSPLAYEWSNGATGDQVSNLSAGAIGVMVTDEIGCALQLSGLITQPSQLLANAVFMDETFAGANNGAASVSPTGGVSPYTVIWSNGSNALTINDLQPGNYGYTLQDANGCTVSESLQIGTSTCFINLQMGATPTSCPGLADGSATATILAGGVGPFSFSWSNGMSGSTISAIPSGNYSVVVTDAAGCSRTGQVNVLSSDTTPPNIELLSDLAVSLGANGFATIEANDLAIGTDNCGMVNLEVFPATVTCNDLGVMEVTFTGTDNSGNQVIAVGLLEVVDQLPPAISCPDNLIISGCGTVEYEVPTAADNCSSNVQLELVSGFVSGSIFPAGQTTVTWRALDNSLNEASCTFTVTVNTDFSVVPTWTNPRCNGDSNGAISLEISGGVAPYDQAWSNPSGPSNLPAGTYSYSVTDSEGCLIEQTVELTEPDALELEILNITPATVGQSNGQIDFEVGGGTAPYVLTWMLGGISLPNFDPNAAAAGSYQLKVEDANGCIFLSSLVVVGTVSGIGDLEIERNIHVSPNPSNGIFNIQLDIPSLQFWSYEIFDATGKRLPDAKAPSLIKSSETIDLQPFNDGVYWLKIVIGDAVVCKKLVKI